MSSFSLGVDLNLISGLNFGLALSRGLGAVLGLYVSLVLGIGVGVGVGVDIRFSISIGIGISISDGVMSVAIVAIGVGFGVRDIRVDVFLNLGLDPGPKD